jgi:hypothetical protein
MKIPLWISIGFFLLGAFNHTFMHDMMAAIHCQLCAMMFIYIAVKMEE